MRLTTAALTLSLLATSLATPAASATAVAAGPSASLNVQLSPERLRASATIIFSFTISDPTGLPPPLTDMSLLYPENIGLVTSGLGLETCQAPTLEALGPELCVAARAATAPTRARTTPPSLVPWPSKLSAYH